MKDEDIAMDFFRGLDNGRYASFKTEIINGLTSKAVQQPKDLNAMFLLANQWLKLTTKGHPSGFASTFSTTLDKPQQQQPCGNPPGTGKKGSRKKGGDGTQKDSERKQPGNAEHFECFACGEIGHYANQCKMRKLNKNSRNNEEDNEERFVHATSDANIFTTTVETYQVNAVNAYRNFK